MITSLLIAAAYVAPALVARKRRMGFFKGLLLSLVLSPVFALPLAMRSKRLPKDSRSDSSGRQPEVRKTSAQETARQPNDPSITDGWILGEGKEHSMDRRVPKERRTRTTSVKRSESRGMKMS